MKTTKTFFYGLIFLILIVGALAISPSDDSSIYGYNLTTAGTGISYSNANQEWSATGAGYLYSQPSKSFKNITVEIHFKGFNDFPDKADTGLFMIGNGTLSSEQFWKVLFISNSSHSQYGRITLDARNSTGSTNFITNTATNSLLRNVTSYKNLTLNIRGTNISIYLDGTYLGYSTLPGGFFQGTATRFYIMRADTKYLNGSVNYFKVSDETGATIAEYLMQNTTCPFIDTPLKDNNGYNLLTTSNSNYLPEKFAYDFTQVSALDEIDSLNNISTDNKSFIINATFSFYGTNYPADSATIFWKDSDIGLRMENGTKTFSCYYYNSTGAVVYLYSVQTAQTGRIYNILCVYNDTSRNLSMFIDGTLESSKIGSTKNAVSSLFRIGGRGSRFLNGTIYDIIITYNSSITSEYLFENYTWISPSGKTYINENTALCPGSYYLNDSSKENIVLNKSGVHFNCNSSTIYGDYRTNFTTGIMAQYDNQYIENCNIKGYSMAIQASYYLLPSFVPFANLTIKNVNASLIGGLAGIFTDGLTSIFIDGYNCFNFTDYGERNIGTHCIYLSGGNDSKVVTSGYIRNMIIRNVSASGVKMNSLNGDIRNIDVKNIDCSAFSPTQGDDYCIHLAQTRNISVHNVTCRSGLDACVVLNVGTNTSQWAHDDYIYENNFSNGVTGIWYRTGHEYNHSIYNNYYPSNLNNPIRVQNNNANSTMNVKYLNESFIKVCKGYGNCKMNVSNVVIRYSTIKLY